MALLGAGPMAPADLARKTGIPSGRVYDVLESLSKKGYVRNLGGRPAKYDAEHPRGVVGLEMKKIQDLAEKELSEAEAAWEVRRDEREESLGNCWTVHGYAGFAREAKTCIEGTEKSLMIFDSDLSWITGKDVVAMKEAISRGVDIQVITSDRFQELLKALQGEKARMRALQNRTEAFYIFDGRRVLVRLQNPEGAVVFDNPTVAQILVSHYARFDKEGRLAK